MVLGSFEDVSIEEAQIKANQNYSAFVFKDLLCKVKEYEMKTLLRSKSKIQKRWKVLAVKCQVLQEILHLDVFDKNLTVKLTEMLKKIQEKRGNSAILVTYKKLAELLKIAFDAKLIETQVSIKIIAKHVPEEKKRDMYIHKKEDMKAFLHVVGRSEKYEIFLVAFLTCSRIGDVIAMKWKDIDLETRKWIYQPQKQKEENKEDVHVPLSNKAHDIIQKRSKENEHVFNTCYRKVRTLWVNFKKWLPSSVQSLTIHDLRQTHIFWAGFKDFLLIQHSLGHKVGGAVGHYVGSGATFEQRKQKIDELDEKLFGKK